MTPTNAALVGVLIAAVFFAVIPGVGAFLQRSRWRRLRTLLISASRFPTLAAASSNPLSTGLCRFFGVLESIQGDSRIWLQRRGLLVGVDLEGCPIYIFSSLADDVEPRVVAWNRLSMIASGTNVFVAGRHELEDGRSMFRRRPESELLVVLFDMPEREILYRAIRSARGRNEYWNQFTLLSLVTGVVVQLAYALLMFQFPQLRGAAVITLTLACYPAAAFLPPGVMLLFPYRRFWTAARRLRADRDVARLPLRHFTDEGLLRPAQAGPLPAVQSWRARLPDGEDYVCVAAEIFGQSGWTVDDRPRLIVPGGVRKQDLHDTRAFLFGADDGAMHLHEPTDPMAQLLKMPANPAELAAASDKRSVWLTWLAAGCIGVGVSVNMLLLLVAFAALIH